VNAISIAVGVGSIVNALLGGHQASVGRGATAIVGGPDAGPAEGRHWAAVIASALALLIALTAGLVVSIVGALPPSFVAVVTGLAVLSTFQDSLQRALGGAFRTGALVAFLVAATPFTAAGLGSSTWALLAGVAVSLAVDRPAETASRPRSAFIASSRAIRSALARAVSPALASPRPPRTSRALASSNEAQADSGR
jgi:benzoate membrane transport protein